MVSTSTDTPRTSAQPHAQLTDRALEALVHTMVADLHVPRPIIFWSDLLTSAVFGWCAFGVAVVAAPGSLRMWAALTISGLALYRGVCFTHELAHLRRRALPGFETTWNVLFGVPLLLPSFTYLGVHQSHHSLSTYGTKDDPEYLPLARSRPLMIAFGIQSSVLLPLLMVVRFLLLSPIALAWPRLHRWLEVHASSFAMNPEYRRQVSPETARKMREWEIGMLAFWAGAGVLIYGGALPVRTLGVWLVTMVGVSLLNTIRVLGAHEYESDGTPRTREGQLGDSIDTPGRLWTEAWAPVGLRYHALHHYFPGIPYHNLGIAYRRLVATLPRDAAYLDSTSPSLARSIRSLYRKAKGSGSLGQSGARQPGA
jgi:fatty acid desaturase